MNSKKCLKSGDNRNTTSHRHHSAILIITALATLFALPALAYRFTPTPLEYQASTEICQQALADRVDRRIARRYPHKYSKDLIWRVGGWHYCGGAIRLNRARLMSAGKAKKELLETAIADVMYSYSRINKNHLWAIEMAATLTEALDELGDSQKAVKVLDDIAEKHPKNQQVLAAYGLHYFRQDQFSKSFDYLLKAYEAGNRKNFEIAYFIGLAAVKNGDIEHAEQYAVIAEEAGYPLKGLRNLISEHKK